MYVMQKWTMFKKASGLGLSGDVKTGRRGVGEVD